MRRPTSRRALAIATMIMCFGLFTAACSSSTSSTTTTVPKVVIAPSITSETVVINGKKVIVPREEYSPQQPIGGQSAEGGQIIISDKGLLPSKLFGPTPITVTWTNLTSKAVSILFAATGRRSPSIAPGATWSITFPKAGTTAGLSYVTSTGYRGSVALGVPLPPIPTTTLPG